MIKTNTIIKWLEEQNQVNNKIFNTKKTFNQLLMEEFDNMDKFPIFEIETEQDEYEIYNLHSETWGIWTFGNGGSLEIKWDSAFSLDEHLQEMFYRCQEDSLL